MRGCEGLRACVWACTHTHTPGVVFLVVDVVLEAGHPQEVNASGVPPAPALIHRETFTLAHGLQLQAVVGGTIGQAKVSTLKQESPETNRPLQINPLPPLG